MMAAQNHREPSIIKIHNQLEHESQHEESPETLITNTNNNYQLINSDSTHYDNNLNRSSTPSLSMAPIERSNQDSINNKQAINSNSNKNDHPHHLELDLDERDVDIDEHQSTSLCNVKPREANIRQQEKRVNIITEQQQQQQPEIQSTITNNNDSKTNKIKNKSKILSWVIDPSSWCYQHWSMVVSLAFLYNFWALSYRFAFKEINEDTLLNWFILDYTADAIYFIDIWFNHHTGYLENGVLERNLDKISVHYRESTLFYLDCFCLLPLDVLYLSIGYNSVLRISRLIKIYKFWSCVDRTERHTNYPNVFRTFTLVHYILVILHWNSCIFHMLSKNKIIDIENLYNFNKNPGDKTARCDDIQCQYLHAFYWSTLAITTIGDLPRPRTKGEYFYLVLELLFGLFLFASLLGHVANIVTNVSAARREFQAKLDAVKTFMRQRRVSEELQKKVVRWFDYLWTSNQSSDEDKSVACLPDKLKAEIAIHVHLDTLKRVDIFQNTEAGFLCELVLRLKPVLFSPGDFVCRKNEVGLEMYIVSRGILEVLTEDSQTVVATLRAGSYFGEISVLNVGLEGNRRTASVRSVGYSDLFCLNKQDLWDVLRNHPNAEARIRARAEERLLKLQQQKKQQLKQQQQHILMTQPSPQLMTIMKQQKQGSASAGKQPGARSLQTAASGTFKQVSGGLVCKDNNKMNRNKHHRQSSLLSSSSSLQGVALKTAPPFLGLPSISHLGCPASGYVAAIESPASGATAIRTPLPHEIDATAAARCWPPPPPLCCHQPGVRLGAHCSSLAGHASCGLLNDKNNIKMKVPVRALCRRNVRGAAPFMSMSGSVLGAHTLSIASCCSSGTGATLVPKIGRKTSASMRPQFGVNPIFDNKTTSKQRPFGCPQCHEHNGALIEIDRLQQMAGYSPTTDDDSDQGDDIIEFSRCHSHSNPIHYPGENDNNRNHNRRHLHNNTTSTIKNINDNNNHGCLNHRRPNQVQSMCLLNDDQQGDGHPRAVKSLVSTSSQLFESIDHRQQQATSEWASSLSHETTSTSEVSGQEDSNGQLARRNDLKCESKNHQCKCTSSVCRNHHDVMIDRRFTSGRHINSGSHGLEPGMTTMPVNHKKHIACSTKMITFTEKQFANQGQTNINPKNDNNLTSSSKSTSKGRSSTQSEVCTIPMEFGADQSNADEDLVQRQCGAFDKLRRGSLSLSHLDVARAMVSSVASSSPDQVQIDISWPEPSDEGPSAGHSKSLSQEMSSHCEPKSAEFATGGSRVSPNILSSHHESLDNKKIETQENDDNDLQQSISFEAQDNSAPFADP